MIGSSHHTRNRKNRKKTKNRSTLKPAQMEWALLADSEPREGAAPAVAVEASVMELLEAAYPNPVTLDR